MRILDHLTDRQADYVRRRCAGESLESIAASFGVAVRTVIDHRFKTLTKLRLRSEREICRYLESGELPPGLAPRITYAPLPEPKPKEQQRPEKPSWRRYPLE